MAQTYHEEAAGWGGAIGNPRGKGFPIAPPHPAVTSPSAADDADGLDLDLDARSREVGDGDQRARRKIAAGEQLAADLDETVAEARLLDEHGHGHEIRQRAAGPAQRLRHEREHPARLRLEVAGDVLAV